MFVSWTGFVDTKYPLSSSGQAFIPYVNNTFIHLTLGEYRYPNTLGQFDPQTNSIELFKNDNHTYRSFLKGSNNYAAAVSDINNDGYSEILVTHNNDDSTEITLYYYHFIQNKWKYKKIKNPYPSPNASITVIPNGFLVSNSSYPPFLVKWNSSKHELEIDTKFSHFHSKEIDTFSTRSIVNMKGLIKKVDGFILNSNTAQHLLPEDTFKQYVFSLHSNHIKIKSWLDNSKMNSTSITFVNINPRKKIYGFLFGNWAQESYLYMFKNNTFLKKHTFPVSYCTSVVAADFDNDGKDEIFFANGYLYNTLYKVHDENKIEEINVGDAYNNIYFAPSSLFYINSTVTADLDGDGFLELCTTNGNYFRYGKAWFKVYEYSRAPGGLSNSGGIFNTEKNRYLRIYPQNKNSSPAIGAVVKVSFSHKKYKRIIDNGGSSMSQNEPIAHFGIGTYDGPINVTVKWTDGTKTVLKDVSSNQVLIVVKT